MQLYLSGLVGVTCSLLALSCGTVNVADTDANVEADTDAEGGNQAPSAFSLINVSNNDTDVDVLPTFSWSAATDPDGDAVGYSLFVDTNSNPAVEVASEINGTSFTLTERLPLIETLFWKVVATDANGARTESETFTFTTRNLNIPSTSVTDNAGFSERQSNTVLDFDNKLWVIAGFDGVLNNDVWNSSDGISWTKVNTVGPIFSARARHTSVVFDNKMWVIGGPDASTKTNDVWSSSDGITWTEATSGAGFSGRDRHTSVVFDNKMWMIGGIDDSTRKSDIWNSSDGTSWTEVTSAAPFSERSSHTSVVFDNKMWVIGGRSASGDLNDVWSSVDGLNWVEESLSGTLFTARSQHTSVVYDNKIWVLAGGKNTIWSTKDGNSWIGFPAELNSRTFHSSTVYNSKIWIIAGIINSTTKTNDVWSFD